MPKGTARAAACQAPGPSELGRYTQRWRSAIRTRSSASTPARPRRRSRPPGDGWPAHNHPDLTGDDPAASRVATRQMAEINDAYAALTRTPTARPDGRDGADGDAVRAAAAARAARRPAAPEADAGRSPAGSTRAATFRPRNQAAGNPARSDAACRASRRSAADVVGSRAAARVDADRAAGTRPDPPLPAADAALARPRVRATSIEFGKFHGHTLGQIAAFEPSYIDWLAAPSPATRTSWPPRGSSRQRPRPPRRRSVGRARPRSARAAPPDPGGGREIAPRYRRAICPLNEKRSISAAVPTVHQACWPKILLLGS